MLCNRSQSRGSHVYVAVLADKAEARVARLIIPLVAEARPDIHTMLVASVVVRLSTPPVCKAHLVFNPEVDAVASAQNGMQLPLTSVGAVMSDISCRPQVEETASSVAARQSRV